VSEYKITVSPILNITTASGILEITPVVPGGDGWVLQSQNFIGETSQISWTWKKENPVSVVAQKPTQNEQKRIYIFSCDFTKKETWHHDSLWATESFPDIDGVQKTFQLAHGSGVGTAVIDLSHKKITEEATIVTPSGGSYIPVVKINGAVQTEREAYKTSGGQYTIDYVAGELTFIATPPSGNTVTIDYFYSPVGVGPIVKASPPTGKKWTLTAAEIQFSTDVIMNDAMVQNVFLQHPVYGYVSAGADVEYANIGTVLDYTYGSFPVVPAHGGPIRGTQTDTIILRWDYLSTIELLSSLSMEMKAWTKDALGFSGERATVTIYGVETDE